MSVLLSNGTAAKAPQALLCGRREWGWHALVRRASLAAPFL